MTPEFIKGFAEHGHDALWRLNSGMYQILVKDTAGNPTGQMPFKLNRMQRKFIRNLHYRNIILKARQLGATTLVCIMWLDYALFNTNVRCGIVAQDDTAATAFFRDKVKFAYENLDPEFKKQYQLSMNSANELRFEHNNSSIRVATSFASATLHRLHVSEYAKICNKYPDKANEVVIGTIPTVPENGVIIIESTGEGAEGDFYTRVKKAHALQQEKRVLTSKDFQFHFFPWMDDPTYSMPDTGMQWSPELDKYFADIEAEMSVTLSAEQKAWYASTLENSFGGNVMQMYSQYPSTPDEPFFVSNEGNYYRSEMANVRKEGRICRIPKLDVPVNTFWDIGNSDGCAIWFHQQVGMEDRFIGYYEAHGEKLGVYIKELQDRGYVYNKHFLPHDASHKRLSDTNESIAEMLAALGVRNIEIVPKVTDLNSGIQIVRTNFPSAYFDVVDCKEGMEKLDNYKKKWNSRDGRWSDEPSKANGCSEGCLIGTTLVLLRSGLTEIQNVRIGDEVWTPAGYALVLQSGVVKLAHELMHIELSNGNELICTPEHKIMSNKGFVYADALRCYDNVFCGEELSCKINSLLSRVTNTGFRQVITRLKTGGVMGFLLDCSAQYGLNIMAQFQRVMKFIILILTLRTMRLQTSCAYPFTIINDCTHSRELKKVHSGRQAQRHCDLPQSGIQLQKELSGIANMVSHVGKKGHGMMLNVLCAIALLHLHIRQGLNTARPDVSTFQQKCKKEEIKIQSYCAEKILADQRIVQRKNKSLAKNIFASALSVAMSLMRHCRLGRNIAQKGVRISRVSAVKVGKSGVLVYDLKIEKHQCYQASGIIVSNSDAFRQWAQAKAAGDVTMAGTTRQAPLDYDVHIDFHSRQGWMG